MIDKHNEIYAKVISGNSDLIDYLYVYFVLKNRRQPMIGGVNYLCGSTDIDHPLLRGAIEHDLKKLSYKEMESLYDEISNSITVKEVPWLNCKDLRQAKFIESLSSYGNKEYIGYEFEFKIDLINKIDWPRSLIQQVNRSRIPYHNGKLNLLNAIRRLWELTKSHDDILKWYNTGSKLKIKNTWN